MTTEQEIREAAADLALQVYGVRIADGIRSGDIKRHHFIDAFAAWNTRTADKEIERLREALRNWVEYDDGDWTEDTRGMIATYEGAIALTRQALGDSE